MWLNLSKILACIGNLHKMGEMNVKGTPNDKNHFFLLQISSFTILRCLYLESLISSLIKQCDHDQCSEHVKLQAHYKFLTYTIFNSK